jgi:DNA-binding transcriptional ArsR family regulator
MKSGAHARRLRLSARLRRSAVRNPVGAFVLIAVSIAGTGLVPLLAGGSTHAPVVIRVAGIVAMLLAPVLSIAAVLYAARVGRAIRSRLADRRDSRTPWTANPPIEKLAADLRRLLWNHDMVMRSIDVARSTWRLRVIEGAITICATQAARALEVPYPDPPPDGGLHQPQLRRLLRALADAGLVLPSGVGLLAPDRHR